MIRILIHTKSDVSKFVRLYFQASGTASATKTSVTSAPQTNGVTTDKHSKWRKPSRINKIVNVGCGYDLFVFVA